MAKVIIEPALPTDAVGLADLVREGTAETGTGCISLDRSSDVLLAANILGTEGGGIFSFRDELTSEVVGEATLAFRNVYVDGVIRRLPHLVTVYIRPAYRNGFLLARSHRYIKDHLFSGDEFGQVQVVKGNHTARKVLTSGKGGFPAYLPYGEYAYIRILFTGQAPKAKTGLEIRRATASDIPAIQAFFDEWAPTKQFYPRYDFSQLGKSYYMGLAMEDFILAFRHGRLVGLTGVWDQGAFKSYQLQEPSKTPPSIAPHPSAEDAGQTKSIKPFFIHSIVIRENDPAVFSALVGWIHREYARSGYARIALGLDAKDPLLAGLEGFPFQKFLSDHFLVTFGKDPRPGLKPWLFYLEAARC